ncbi:two-component response regulator ARR1 [Gossypium raimondii]|uniref:Response regulatory domain-containing protein n=1 Tax=Gossypium raimondii TaxID=29730 RepID=A0A0D2U1H9_GOSRA|nr:two-component response regulator ARR1 [Gossypium raimondii]KJB49390.1 hypothetical protein B456_008G116600 [Gossypium raimondii]
MAISVESNMNNVYAGVTVLLVDGDSTCVIILSKMLRSFGYKVVTTKRATDALCIIRDQQHKIDLVLTEACLHDMDKYELLETIRNISSLPIIVMSTDYDRNAVLGSLFKGAALHLEKPITMDDIKNLWQFTLIKGREINVPIIEAKSCIKEVSSMESALGVVVDGRRNLRDEKRKRPLEVENDKEGDNWDQGSSTLKKPKLIWTNELHNRFLQAIDMLGSEAYPKKILQLMNVPGLRKENVSSHLQKHRLSLKRQQEAILNTISSTESQAASHHALSEFSPRNGFHLFTDTTQTTSVAEQHGYINGLVQDNLNG